MTDVTMGTMVPLEPLLERFKLVARERAWCGEAERALRILGFRFDHTTPRRFVLADPPPTIDAGKVLRMLHNQWIAWDGCGEEEDDDCCAERDNQRALQEIADLLPGSPTLP